MINNNSNKKKKKGSNRMEPCKSLIHSDSVSKMRYLNVSAERIYSYAGMAEWLLQQSDTLCPSGCGGSIPSAGVAFNLGGYLL